MTIQVMTTTIPEPTNTETLLDTLVALAQDYTQEHGVDPNYLAFHPDDTEAKMLAASLLDGPDVYVIDSDGVPEGEMVVFYYDPDDPKPGSDDDPDDEPISKPKQAAIVPSNPGIMASQLGDDRPYLSHGEYVAIATLETDELISAVHDALTLWREKNPDFPEPRHVGLPNDLPDEVAKRLDRYFAENNDIYPWYQPSQWRVGKHNVAVGINMR